MHVHHEPVREEIAKSNRHSAAFVSGGRHCHNYGEFHIRKRKCAAQQIPVHVTSVGSRVHRSWRTFCSAKRGKAKSEQNERERDGKGEREQKKRNTSIRVGSSLCLIRTHAKCRHNFGFVCHFKLLAEIYLSWETLCAPLAARRLHLGSFMNSSIEHRGGTAAAAPIHLCSTHIIECWW